MNIELKAAITAKYGTQKVFAKELGIGENRVSYIIQGRHTLSENEKARWAEALGVPAEILFDDRQIIVDQMHSITDRADLEKRELTAGENREYRRLHDQYRALRRQAKIKQHEVEAPDALGEIEVHVRALDRLVRAQRENTITIPPEVLTFLAEHVQDTAELPRLKDALKGLVDLFITGDTSRLLSQEAKLRSQGILSEEKFIRTLDQYVQFEAKIPEWTPDVDNAGWTES